jgi:mRNA interferase MazF
MKYKIYLTNFAFVDDPMISKLRPVLALTNNIGKYEFVVCAFISSNIDILGDYDILLKKENVGFDNTGLSFDSVLKISKLQTIPFIDFKSELGMLPTEYISKVNDNLTKLFGV